VNEFFLSSYYFECYIQSLIRLNQIPTKYFKEPVKIIEALTSLYFPFDYYFWLLLSANIFRSELSAIILLLTRLFFPAIQYYKIPNYPALFSFNQVLFY